MNNIMLHASIMLVAFVVAIDNDNDNGMNGSTSP